MLAAVFGFSVFGLAIVYVQLLAPDSQGWPAALAAAGVFLCPMFAVIIVAESIIARWSRRAESAAGSAPAAFSPVRHFLRVLASYLGSAAGLLALAIALDWLWKRIH